jgi:hypothetical protein
MRVRIHVYLSIVAVVVGILDIIANKFLRLPAVNSKVV